VIEQLDSPARPRPAAAQPAATSPGKIGDIARAALVLTHFEHGYLDQMKISEITSVKVILW
jgi:hypothetical protein